MSELAAAERRLEERRARLATTERPSAPRLVDALGSADPGELADRWESLPRFTCPACEEEYTGEPDAGGMCVWCAGKAAQGRRSQPKDRARALAAAGVPERYLQPFVAPDPWPTDPTLGISADRWPELIAERWAVVLAGPDYGAGKSMLAAELLWRLAQSGKSIGWVRAAHLVSALYGNRGAEARAAAYGLESVGAVVVDELGRAHTAEATWETLGDWLGVRYEHCRPTIITTNLRRDQIEPADGSLWDRLRDAMIVPVLGESRRGR